MILNSFLSNAGEWEDQITWNTRTVSIVNDKGETIFEQEVEAPEFWSDRAVTIVASKYFKMQDDIKENSVKQLINRVVNSIINKGRGFGYFNSEQSKLFKKELALILANQYASFNSPVWFNVGLGGKESANACFILDIKDDMESILDWYKKEGLIFKYGSGSGVNISPLRSFREKLSNGGHSSGPVSFMKVADANGGAIKSGGFSRRSSKAVIMNVDHPDIIEFIDCKIKEEEKAKILIDAGYSSTLDGEAYSTVAFQNSNHMVRLTDEFLKAVERGEQFDLKGVDGEVITTLPAQHILDEITYALWKCGDPGLQFHNVINEWNTVADEHEISASNPCSEFMFVNNSACNLASMKLTRFLDEDNIFNVDLFKHVIEIMLLAQDILVGLSHYPTTEIEQNSKHYRPLGLGYTDLGALLMRLGLPYDSEDARAVAANITAYMTAVAYITSNAIAKDIGSFKGLAKNRNSFIKVLSQHIQESHLLPKPIENFYELRARVKEEFKVLQKIVLEDNCKFRNAQVTLLAPTGTLSLKMDCDTTGIEPEFSLIKYKKLVGGGTISLVNSSVEKALRNLNVENIDDVLEYVKENNTLEGLGLSEDIEDVFTCAMASGKGTKCLKPKAHIDMMAAVQPFLSGAISKTCSLSCDVTPEEIKELILYSWKKGLKGVTFYRDGCKCVQPLTSSKDVEKIKKNEDIIWELKPARRKLEPDCMSLRHKFRIGEHKGYIHVGLFEDNTPGEIFITMSKEGSTISGLMDAIATLTSIALQYGVPVNDLIEKFKFSRFPPDGFTNNKNIPIATSIIDYVFRYIEILVKGNNELIQNENSTIEIEHDTKEDHKLIENGAKKLSVAGPPCSKCGSIMVRAGTCYLCSVCGETGGCS